MFNFRQFKEFCVIVLVAFIFCGVIFALQIF